MATASATAGSQTATVTESPTHVVLAPKEKRRLDYKPPEFRVKHVSLDFQLDAPTTLVHAELDVYRVEGTPHGTNLELHGDSLELIDVAVGGKVLAKSTEYHLDAEGQLVIEGKLLPEKANEVFRLTTNVKIHPDKNLQLQGLYATGEMLCTQCEAEGFRRITYYLDRPDVMAKFRVRLEADKEKYPVLLSNGDQVEAGDVPGKAGRHFAVFVDPHPKPAYLFAVVAGKLKSLEDTHMRASVDGKPGRPVRLSVWYEEKDAGKLDWAMEAVKKAMKWDEERFGRVYDLDWFNVVCVSFFNMGAMENKSLNIFNSSLLLASRATSTDVDFLRILGVVGHEYFHNWTGNRVTCRDWFQLTLKEGLTVFRDQEFSADMGSAAVQRVQVVIDLRSMQFSEDAGPMAHPIRPEAYIVMDNFYTMTVYRKGSEVIRMYQTLLGRDGFRKGMDLYFKRHDGQAVTCDDFRSAMADANGVDLTQFERWYLQAGTPEVTVTGANWDEGSKKFKITLAQSTPPTPGQTTKLPFPIPVSVGLIGRNSKQDVVPTRVLELVKSQQTFEFENVTEPVVASVLRNFSAPVKLNFEQSDEDLAFLFAHDSDEFNRWEAGQKLFTRVIMERAQKIMDGVCAADNAPELPKLLVDSFRALLANEKADTSLKALAMELPYTISLISDMKPVSCPISLHAARSSIRRQLAAALKKELLTTYNAMTQQLSKVEFDVTPLNVGRRALRNLCLSFICTAKDEEAIKLAESQFKSATTMTEKMAAFRCLLTMPGAAREDAIRKFYEDAKGDELTIDKWFAAQATSDYVHAADEVLKLQSHADYTIKNPNRCRSLMLTFTLNAPHFHRDDGKGYEMLQDIILKVDKVNSQVAGRMAKALINFQGFSEKRQGQMKRCLKRIIEEPGLTSATFEVVNLGLKA